MPEAIEELKENVAVEEAREKVALSCRILVMEKLAVETFGHVSARLPGSDEILMRCRGNNERGVNAGLKLHQSAGVKMHHLMGGVMCGRPS